MCRPTDTYNIFPSLHSPLSSQHNGVFHVHWKLAEWKKCIQHPWQLINVTMISSDNHEFRIQKNQVRSQNKKCPIAQFLSDVRHFISDISPQCTAGYLTPLINNWQLCCLPFKREVSVFVAKWMLVHSLVMFQISLMHYT